MFGTGLVAAADDPGWLPTDILMLLWSSLPSSLPSLSCDQSGEGSLLRRLAKLKPPEREAQYDGHRRAYSLVCSAYSLPNTCGCEDELRLGSFQEEAGSTLDYHGVNLCPVS